MKVLMRLLMALLLLSIVGGCAIQQNHTPQPSNEEGAKQLATPAPLETNPATAEQTPNASSKEPYAESTSIEKNITPVTAVEENSTQSSEKLGFEESCKEENVSKIKLTIGDTILTATLIENSSSAKLMELLAENTITINMDDYGNMEKVGSLGSNLPTNNEQITTEAGDLILYQGNALVIYYAPNSWNFTRLGKIDDITTEELKRILGDGSITVKLSLK